jgi:hypothetical protein
MEYTTRVYKYGLRPPTENVDLIDEQISRAHSYYNKLIEIEQEKSARYRAVVSAHHDIETQEQVAAQHKAAVVALVEEIKAWRIKARKKIAPKEMRDKLAEAKAVSKAAYATLRELRHTIKTDPEIVARLQEVYDWCAVARKQARKECRKPLEGMRGCYWGTYLLIEQSVDAAREAAIKQAKEAAKAVAKDAAKATPPPEHGERRVKRHLGVPHFRRWTGHGSVGAQIQHGLSIAEVMSCEDTRLRIEPVPETAWDKGHKRECWTMLWLRIGSNGRTPIWAKWPVILHRPFPLGAQIVWVKVLREKIEAKYRWSVHLTLRIPIQKPTCGDGSVAVDIGWRRTEDGMRVGYWQDGARYHDILMLPNNVITEFQKLEDLQSIRDKNKNVMYIAFKAWLDAQDKRTLPEWFREAIRTIHTWKSPARFAALAIRWRDKPDTKPPVFNRWPGDDAGFALIESWRKQDKHLWTWEVNLRDQVQRHRREGYRVIAAQLAQTYGTLVLTDFDLRNIQRHVAMESDKKEIELVRWQQKTACCSNLRQCLTDAFKSRGGRVVTVEAKLVTRTCHVCGYAEPWKRPAELNHTCDGCGRTWDRDVNSTTNMLRRAYEGPLPEKKKETQPKWSRRGRHNKPAPRVAASPRSASGRVIRKKH